MLPERYLCDIHRPDNSKDLKQTLWRRIESIKRSACACDLDSLYQWYDLTGKFLAGEGDSDLLNPENT